MALNQPLNMPGNDFGISDDAILNSGIYGPTPAVQPQMQQATHDFDPNTGLSREAWRDQYQGLGSISPQAADQWLRSHNAIQQAGKGDVWMTPYGDRLDLQMNRGAANANGGNINTAWTGVGQDNSNGSVMNNGGAPSNNGGQFDIGALLQMLQQGNTPAPMQSTSAQPYNPHANQTQNNPVSNYFGNQYQSTGQTDGTLLGTTMSSSQGSNNMQVGASSKLASAGKGYAQPFSMSSGFSGSNQTMGAPSFYNQGQDTGNQKPLPPNNMSTNGGF